MVLCTETGVLVTGIYRQDTVVRTYHKGSLWPFDVARNHNERGLLLMALGYMVHVIESPVMYSRLESNE